MRRLLTVVLMWLVVGSGVQAQDMEPPTIISDVRWHPRGEGLLVTGRAGPGVFGVWRFDTDLQLLTMLRTENLVSIAWSPDGMRFSTGGEIRDARSLELLLTLNANSGIGGWSPDGMQVLAWADELSLGLYESRTGELLRTISVGEIVPDAVSWSPNGAYFALLLPTGITNIISAEDGRQIASIPMAYPIGLRWSPDSQYLAAAFYTEVEPGTPNILPYALSPTIAFVMVWDALSGSVVQEFSGLPALPLEFSWHPQRPELAGGAGEGIVYIWNIETEEQELFRSLSALTNLEYSVFGGRLVVGSWRENQVAFDTQPFEMASPIEQVQDVVPDTLVLIVPDPSIERLNAIAAACDAPVSPSIDMTDYITQVEALPADSIPPACAADLVAVARALEGGS
ncbi:MAG: WD40 repeat domain-containing protein [Pleurocapsa minor GSE-CHR-MK-17-07R]|jgi:WD40 repeat protein|nr:WD40 repeat domain-containing protein [Pleurocapsa minor GSE-CHR-MK 17-07R]